MGMNIMPRLFVQRLAGSGNGFVRGWTWAHEIAKNAISEIMMADRFIGLIRMVPELASTGHIIIAEILLKNASSIRVIASYR
jgi:hypothetical protein